MLYIIYKTTHIDSGKYYVGKHKTKKLDDGYLGSGTYLKRAIKKYGKEAFVRVVLYVLETEEDMNDKEAALVTENMISDPLCYNLCYGGRGGFGYINSTRDHVKHNQKLADSRDYSLTDRSYMLNEAWQIRHVEIIENMIKHRCVNSFKGRHHSVSSKEKIGRANSKAMSGKGNSQYGKRWIYSDEEQICKRINKKDPLPLGWEYGAPNKYPRT